MSICLTEAAFNHFYETFKVQVYMYCRQRLPDIEDAEDATVETFTALWRHRHSIKDPEHLKEFLYQAALQKTLDLRRINKHKGMPLPEDVLSVVDEGSNNIEEHERWIRLLITEILDRADALPPRCRQVFKYYMANMPATKIAAVMGINVRAVYDHCDKAKQKIRASLKKKGLDLAKMP